MLWLAIIAVTMSFVSLYYYLVVIREMYISKPEVEGRVAVPAMVSGLVVLLVAGVFYFGLYPRHVFEAAQGASTLLFS
jgi:NADH-quinone oxidoreductase subunit N